MPIPLMTSRMTSQSGFDWTRPVYVRDGALEYPRRCKDADDAAPRSKYAGYGVPKEAMDALVEKDAESEGD